MSKTDAHDNYYDVLNLPKDCSSEDIHDSYVKLSKLHHPDKNVDKEYSHEKFIRIREAYMTLKNPAKRRQYDYYLSKKYYRKFNDYDYHSKTSKYKMDFSYSYHNSSSNGKFRNSLLFRLVLMPKAFLITTFIIITFLIGSQHMFLLQNNEKKQMTLKNNSFMISLIYEHEKEQGMLLGKEEMIRRMKEGTLKSVDPQKLLDEYNEKMSKGLKQNCRIAIQQS